MSDEALQEYFFTHLPIKEEKQIKNKCTLWYLIAILIIILRTKSIFWVSAQLLISSEKNFELSQIHANEGNPGLGLEQEVTATEHSECFCPEKWEVCHSFPCVDLKTDLFPPDFPSPSCFPWI